MYERSYGYLYDKGRRVQDDAANIRRHIKTMTKAGALPADWKYSVRYQSFAGGCAIEVRGESPRSIYAADPRAFREHVRHAETGEWVFGWQDRLTLEAQTVLKALHELHDAHNHDGSDVQSDYFDVKFYGTPSVTVADGVPEYVAAEVRS